MVHALDGVSGVDLSPVVSAVEVLTLLKPHYSAAVHENRTQKAISGLETSKCFHLCFLQEHPMPPISFYIWQADSL